MALLIGFQKYVHEVPEGAAGAMNAHTPVYTPELSHFCELQSGQQGAPEYSESKFCSTSPHPTQLIKESDRLVFKCNLPLTARP